MLVLLYLMAPLLMSQSPSPLIDYQAMQNLKEILGTVVVEIEVVMQVSVGADPNLAPVVLGQGACLQDLSGRGRLVTSQALVDNAQSIRVRSRKTPEWTSARVVREDPAFGLVEIVPAREPEFVCTILRPATVTQEQPRALVFSIDNPLRYTNIFWGYIEGRAEAPLNEFLLTASGLPLGGPLFSIDGSLTALNLRRYTPSSAVFLAVTSTQILRWLRHGGRRPASPPARMKRREIKQPGGGAALEPALYPSP